MVKIQFPGSDSAAFRKLKRVIKLDPFVPNAPFLCLLKWGHFKIQQTQIFEIFKRLWSASYNTKASFWGSPRQCLNYISILIFIIFRAFTIGKFFQKISEKLTFLTPWHAKCKYQNFAHKRNKWSLAWLSQLCFQVASTQMSYVLGH